MIFLSVITLPVSIVSFTLPPFAMCSGWRESGCRRGVGSATASAPSSPGIAQAQGAVAPWDRGRWKRRRQEGSNLGVHVGRQFLPPSWGGTCLPLSAVVPVGRNKRGLPLEEPAVVKTRFGDLAVTPHDAKTYDVAMGVVHEKTDS